MREPRSPTASRRVIPDEIASLLRPGMKVFVQGVASESTLIRDALRAQPGAARGVHFFGALVPGINEFDYASLHPQARFTGLFLSAAHAASASAGKAFHLPIGYSEACRQFEAMHFDLAIVQIATPNSRGNCSLGITADFASAVLPRARHVLAHVNPQMPSTKSLGIDMRALDYVLEADSPLMEVPADEVDEVSLRIARHVAALVCDGDCLQLGLGKIPSAVLGCLRSHRDLGLHTGLLTDAALPLLREGIFNGARKKNDAGRHVTGALAGSRALYDLASDPSFLVCAAQYTHNARILADIDNFVSINSALEVDLLGQMNGESINGRQISGVGGALDFVRGAFLSKGGRSIIALPSTTRDGRSRILRRLATGTPITIPRSDTSIVVTEYGVADLRGKTAPQRERLLVDIAHPDHRPALEGATPKET